MDTKSRFRDLPVVGISPTYKVQARPGLINDIRTIDFHHSFDLIKHYHHLLDTNSPPIVTGNITHITMVLITSILLGDLPHCADSRQVECLHYWQGTSQAT